MVKEYIEREAAIQRIRIVASGVEFDNPLEAIDTCVAVIDCEPAVDVATVVHGRWECADTDTEQFFLCNRCKKKEYWESDYCPNCGCRMDGGADE